MHKVGVVCPQYSGLKHPFVLLRTECLADGRFKVSHGLVIPPPHYKKIKNDKG